MRKLKTLNINTIEHLSKLIAIPQNKLIKIFEDINANENNFYSSHNIPKKSGEGNRRINPPIIKLKQIQRKINQLLQRLLFKDSMKGGFKGCSHINHAKEHLNRNIVVTMDISDFFPSVKSGRIYNIFIKRLHCCPDVARILTRLTTYQGHLPQGSPTSGILSVLATEKLAMRLFHFADKNNAKFSIYMDDIAFSANYELPNSFIERAKLIITQEAYHLKDDKTKVMAKYETEQIITGLKINNINIEMPTESYDKLIQEINSVSSESSIKQLKSIDGKLNYWAQIKIKSSKANELKKNYINLLRK